MLTGGDGDAVENGNSNGNGLDHFSADEEEEEAAADVRDMAAVEEESEDDLQPSPVVTRRQKQETAAAVDSPTSASKRRLGDTSLRQRFAGKDLLILNPTKIPEALAFSIRFLVSMAPQRRNFADHCNVLAFPADDPLSEVAFSFQTRAIGSRRRRVAASTRTA